MPVITNFEVIFLKLPYFFLLELVMAQIVGFVSCRCREVGLFHVWKCPFLPATYIASALPSCHSKQELLLGSSKQQKAECLNTVPEGLPTVHKWRSEVHKKLHSGFNFQYLHRSLGMIRKYC